MSIRTFLNMIHADLCLSIFHPGKWLAAALGRCRTELVMTPLDDIKPGENRLALLTLLSTVAAESVPLRQSLPW